MKLLAFTIVLLFSGQSLCSVLRGKHHWKTTADSNIIYFKDDILLSNIDERGLGVEGDMIFPQSLSSGLIDTMYRWPNGVIVYKIDPAFSTSEISMIYSGMQDISSKTCIRFREQISESDYVYIQKTQSGGCNSVVGRVGGKQNLNLQAPVCIMKGVISHELIHSIGFRHEHSRTDRDDYIEIRWANVNPNFLSAFNKYGSGTVSGFGVPYDYDSIMHYSPYAFAANSKLPTIIPKQAGANIGQRVALSRSDALKINNMYNNCHV